MGDLGVTGRVLFGGSEGSTKASEGIIRLNRGKNARFFVVEIGSKIEPLMKLEI